MGCANYYIVDKSSQSPKKASDILMSGEAFGCDMEDAYYLDVIVKKKREALEKEKQNKEK